MPSDNPAPAPAPTPTLHPSHITAYPVSTILGVMAGLQGVLLSLPGGDLPTTSAGWMTLAMSLGMAAFGALAKG